MSKSKQKELEDIVAVWQGTLLEDGRQYLCVDGVDYYYENGLWRIGTEKDQSRTEVSLAAIARQRDAEYASNMNALWKTLRTRYGNVQDVAFDTRPMLVCNNGTVDLHTSEIHPHSPDHYCTRAVDIDFDPDAKCEEWEAMLERVFQGYSDEERKQHIELVQEFFGLSVVGDHRVQAMRELRRALLIYGVAGSGKSAVAETLKTLMGGDKHIVSANLDTLGKEFGMEAFLSARAYISDDGIDKNTVADTKTLKKLVTGESMSVNRKLKSHVEFRFNGPVVFTSNELPDFTDQTSGVYSRIITIETRHVFTAADKKKLGKVQNVQTYLKNKKQFPGILNWALAGYDRILERVENTGRGYVVPRSASDMETKMRETNDPVFDFLRNECEFDPKVYTSASVVNWAASLFSADVHYKRLARKAAAHQIRRRVQEVYPDVEIERVWDGASQPTAYLGLRLKDAAANRLKKASETDPNAMAAYKSVNLRRSSIVPKPQ